MPERITPASVEAEQSVLGCMLLSEAALATACAALEPEDFYTPAHKELFDAAKSMYAKSRPVDLVTLTEELRGRGSLDGIGGLTYLASLTQIVPGVTNVEAYIKLVSDKATMRRLIESGNQIASMGFDASLETQEALDLAQQNIFDIAQRRGSGRGFVALNEQLVNAYDTLEKSFANKQKITGIATGFTELDLKTSGLHGSELILVAARPSMGKSSFVMNVAMNAALREKKTVAMFTLEDSADQLINRMLCCEAMVDMQSVRTGTMQDDDWSKLLAAMSTMGESRVYIDDTPGITVMDIRSKCRRLKMEKGLDMITIDYLQLMSAPGNSENRQQQISEMTRSLKELARELDVPVIVLSQLNRAVETRPDHTPMMSDLRESGSIEQDADLIIFLFRESYYNPAADNMADIILAKQRNGPTGVVKLLWQGQYTRFMNPAAGWQEDAAGAQG